MFKTIITPVDQAHTGDLKKGLQCSADLAVMTSHLLNPIDYADLRMVAKLLPMRGNR